MFLVRCGVQDLLEMTVEDFQKLPAWKQIDIKKKIGLFWPRQLVHCYEELCNKLFSKYLLFNVIDNISRLIDFCLLLLSKEQKILFN